MSSSSTTLSDLGSMTISVSTLLNLGLTAGLAAGVYFLATSSSSGSTKGSKSKKKGSNVSPAAPTLNQKTKKAKATAVESGVKETNGKGKATIGSTAESDTSAKGIPNGENEASSGAGSKKKKNKGKASAATTSIPVPSNGGGGGGGGANGKNTSSSVAPNGGKSFAAVAASGATEHEEDVNNSDDEEAIEIKPSSFAKAVAANNSSSFNTVNAVGKPKKTGAVASEPKEPKSFSAAAAASTPVVPTSSINGKTGKAKKNSQGPQQPILNQEPLAKTHQLSRGDLEERLDPALKDMRDESHDPKIKVARVLKVVGGNIGANEIKQAGQDQEQWEGGFGDDQEEDEGEWAVAGSKKPSKSNHNSASHSSGSIAFSTSNPAPSMNRSIPGLTPSIQASMTKKQRENQAKASKAAAVKEQAELERLERLKEHRKALERTRMLEQEAQRNKGSKKKTGPRGVHYPTTTSASAKLQSGGMRASFSEDGKLIWE